MGIIFVDTIIANVVFFLRLHSLHSITRFDILGLDALRKAHI